MILAPPASIPFRGLLLLPLLALASPLVGQVDLRDEVVAGGEVEAYLRVLQVSGAVPLAPWGLRGLSPLEVDRLLAPDSAHPWRARFPSPDSIPTPRLRALRPSLGLSYNTTFPYGQNDGPVWAGRGLTAVATAGLRFRSGPLSVRLEPLVYWSENRSFQLLLNRFTDSIPFLDPHTGNAIDLPQRFGDGAFARIDPGQSTVRVDGRGFALGVSTANQIWGPAAELPLVLGANAPGFPHLFGGTSGPWRIGIGRAHGRLMWGELGQSEYSYMREEQHGSRRFMSGFVAIFLPYGLDGLEIGLARFFHDAWPAGGLRARHFARPLEAFYKVDLGFRDEPGGAHEGENQLASVFFRWALPESGFEVYGEYAREDYSWDFLDLVLEPDRKPGFMLGGRRVWARGDALLSLRAEWLDTQPNALNQAVRTGHFYRHSNLRQGHTVGGQLLGSPAAYGGGGSLVGFDRYSPAGRWGIDWTRTRVASPSFPIPRDMGATGVDVIHSLGGTAVVFRNGWDLYGELRGSLELNRHFRGDAFNLTAALGVRAGIPSGGP